MFLSSSSLQPFFGIMNELWNNEFLYFDTLEKMALVFTTFWYYKPNLEMVRSSQVVEKWGICVKILRDDAFSTYANFFEKLFSQALIRTRPYAY